MVTSGLIDEARQVFQYLQQERATGREVDLSRGIWQSIGFKQFMDYLETTEPPSSPSPTTVEGLKTTAIEAVKGATRRYASMQTRWIQNKLKPLLRNQHPDAMRHLFVMDSTDLTTWREGIVEPAVAITRQFMEGKDLPSPTELSETANNLLEMPSQGMSAVPCRHVCEVCEVTVLYEHLWEEHIKSTRHRRRWKARKKKALVPVNGNPSLQVPPEAAGNSDESTPRSAVPDPNLEIT
jgi:tRNA dimethylallyltransferase